MKTKNITTQPAIYNTNTSGPVSARRTLFKGAVLASGAAAALPHSWIKPVIKSVVLPAHAQATDDV